MFGFMFGFFTCACFCIFLKVVFYKSKVYCESEISEVEYGEIHRMITNDEKLKTIVKKHAGNKKINRLQLESIMNDCNKHNKKKMSKLVMECLNQE